MKKSYKIFTGVILLCTTLFSCSTDSTEVPVESALDKELNLDNSGVFQIGSTTYVFKASGETAKFIDENKVFDFVFDNEQSFTAQKSGEKHAGESMVITNSVTGETINLLHLEELKNGGLKFDLELSTGEKFYSVVYSPGNAAVNSGRWHEEPPAVGFTRNVVNGTLQLAQQDLSGSCEATITTCTRSGGNATVILNNQHGWFTTPATCRVVCN